MFFCEFCHRNGHFPGTQNLIIIPTPRIPSFIRTDEIISPTRLFERFQFTDARGLVSIQALAALSLYLSGDENTDVVTEPLTEFLHSMSLQGLNVENDTVLLKFTELHLLMDELRGLVTEGILASAIYNRQVPDRVNQEVNDYKYAYDLSEAERIQMEVDKMISTGEKAPEIKPDCIPLPLLTTDEIKENATKKMKISLKRLWLLEMRKYKQKKKLKITQKKFN